MISEHPGTLFSEYGSKKKQYIPFEWEVLFHFIPGEEENVFFQNGKNTSQTKGKPWEIPMN
jgi:hypothetical protein